jgi:UDP-glucose 4-epimerase
VSLADPALDARTNVEGTINVLEAARTAGADRVVFA